MDVCEQLQQQRLKSYMSDAWNTWTRAMGQAFLDAYGTLGADPPAGARGHGIPEFREEALGGYVGQSF